MIKNLVINQKISKFLYSSASKSGWRDVLIRTAWKTAGFFLYQSIVLKSMAKHIPNKTFIYGIQKDEEMHLRIRNQLIGYGINVIDININLNKYNQFINDAGYGSFPLYLGGGTHSIFKIKKALEHYLAYELLQLDSDDIYIDIANANSPVPEIYSKLSGCKSYRQDLCFPNGISGNIIGGDASNMPIANGFATKMALHCSFEHFECDSDVRFVKEASRVLKSKGKLFIIPLYMYEDYVIQTDPMTRFLGKTDFDKDAKVYFKKFWGNRHERHYNAEKLLERIILQVPSFKTTIFYIVNEKQVHPKCPVKFALLLEKL